MAQVADTQDCVVGAAEGVLVIRVCAWCEDEGRPIPLVLMEPFNDPRPTHGICAEHLAAFTADLKAALASRPDAPRGEDAP